MNRSHAIEMTSLTLAAEHKVLLRDFGLTVDPGQKILVTGPSGCGKSSLLKCILGLIQPLAGTVIIQGTVLNEDTVWSLRQHMAYVAQEPDLGGGTVRQALERPFSYKANRDLHARLVQVPRWLDRLLLSPALLDKSVSQLSGGEKQRVALIGALLLQRPILLLDEITSALDPDSRKAAARVLAEQGGQTLLMISHDPSHFDFAERTLAWPEIPKEL